MTSDDLQMKSPVMPKLVTTAAILVPLVLIASLPAAAQRPLTDADVRALAADPAVSAAIAACRADRWRFCATVAPGGGRIAICLAAHTESLSPACQAAMLEARAAIETRHPLPSKP